MIHITTLHRVANGRANIRAALSCPNPDEAQAPRATVVLLMWSSLWANCFGRLTNNFSRAA